MLPKKGSGGTLGLLRPPPLSAFKRQLQPFRLSKGHELLHPHTPTVGWPLPCPGAAHRPTFPSTFISPLMAPLLENLGWGRPWRCPQRPEEPWTQKPVSQGKPQDRCSPGWLSKGCLCQLEPCHPQGLGHGVRPAPRTSAPLLSLKLSPETRSVWRKG